MDRSETRNISINGSDKVDTGHVGRPLLAISCHSNISETGENQVTNNNTLDQTEVTCPFISAADGYLNHEPGPVMFNFANRDSEAPGLVTFSNNQQSGIPSWHIKQVWLSITRPYPIQDVLAKLTHAAFGMLLLLQTQGELKINCYPRCGIGRTNKFNF